MKREYKKISVRLKGFWYAKVFHIKSGKIIMVSNGYRFAFMASGAIEENFKYPYYDLGMGHKYFTRPLPN